MPFYVAGASLLGGYLAGESAKSAAETSASGQRESAQMAADASRFRPVGVTTRYGSSNFQTDAQGNGKACGTLWFSLVSLPTLVVLSSESLRSSFICLSSRGAPAMVSSLTDAGLADLKARE